MATPHRPTPAPSGTAEANPSAIRAALPASQRDEFDADWQRVLAAARTSLDLHDVHAMLDGWWAVANAAQLADLEELERTARSWADDAEVPTVSATEVMGRRGA